VATDPTTDSREPATTSPARALRGSWGRRVARVSPTSWQESAPPNRWARHGLAALARTALTVLLGLALWTVLPLGLGWQPTVVLTGSMQPAVRPGDVVLTREVPPEALRPGHVLLVTDPARPGTLLLHRYVRTDADGGLVLRGDANAADDAQPVTAQDVRGVGVLRVPWVGLVHAWLAAGRVATTGLLVLGLGALLALSRIRERTPAGTDGAAPGEQPRTPAPAAVTGLVLVLAGTVTAGPQPVAATFSGSVTVAASFTAGTWEAPVP